jgi:hypothetical protein
MQGSCYLHFMSELEDLSAMVRPRGPHRPKAIKEQEPREQAQKGLRQPGSREASATVGPA